MSDLFRVAAEAAAAAASVNNNNNHDKHNSRMTPHSEAIISAQ